MCCNNVLKQCVLGLDRDAKDRVGHIPPTKTCLLYVCCSKSALVYLPEDEGAHEDAGHRGIRPGVSIQLMRGKLAVALNIYHLHGQLRVIYIQGLFRGFLISGAVMRSSTYRWSPRTLPPCPLQQGLT